MRGAVRVPQLCCHFVSALLPVNNCYGVERDCPGMAIRYPPVAKRKVGNQDVTL
jgi:hypothetical protein